jgi:hypothetical protein
MVQDWERIGDLMTLAVNHWATYRPAETLASLEAGTLAERAYAAAKVTQEQIYSQDDHFNRMDMWEIVREDSVLMTPEKTWERPPSNKAFTQLKKLGFGFHNLKRGAQALVDEYLEKKGIPPDWSPEKEKRLKAQTAPSA